MSNLITLTSDFGQQDAYVAAMKGVALSINPEAKLVDVTHQVPPQDVMTAAFVLRETVSHYPDGTIHLVVVDPGVGTQRKAIAVRHNNQTFVGPDNGLFSLILEDDEPDEVVSLSNKGFWRTDAPSATFHGRDIFAPAAAHLSRGLPMHELGEPLESLKPLRWAMPIVDKQGIQGWTVHVDRFGNCISNIPKQLMEEHRNGRSIKCYAGSEVINSVRETYASVADGEPVALFGSSGYLEVGVNGGNAAELLSIRKGDRVNVVFSDDSA